MKLAKSMALMAAGVGATLLYQKYKKPMEKEIDKTINKSMRAIDKKLENMS